MNEILSVVETLFNLLSGGLNTVGSVFTQSIYTVIVRAPADAVMDSTALATLYTNMIPIALMFIMIAFFSKLSEMAIDEQLNADKIIKEIIILVLVLMVMDNAVTTGTYGIDGNAGWLQKFYHMATDITDEIIADTTISNGTTIASNFVNAIKTTPFAGKSWVDILSSLADIWNAIWGLMTGALMLIVSGIITAFVFGVAIYRAVKIGIYIILAPFGFAAAYDKGGVGLKFLKKIIVLYIQEPIIILSVYLLYSAQTTVGGLTGIGGTFMIGIMMISAVLSSERKAKELLN